MHVLAHGGAGGEPEDPQPRRAALQRAVDAGASQEEPLDAVEETIGRLEADPRFNAGRGGARQSDGAVRTDAGMMTGEGGVGAAAGMEDIAHASSVARVVLEETPHVMIAGEPAVALAREFEISVDQDLTSERSRERWRAIEAPTGGPRAHLEWVRRRFGGSDTVGAVATDGERLAVGTSTAGRWFALAGRVGDVPQVGSGFFASERAAASATGAGEDIARVGLARLAVEEVSAGKSPQAAADSAIETFAARTGSRAGVIVLDREGRGGEAVTEATMQTAERS